MAPHKLVPLKGQVFTKRIQETGIGVVAWYAHQQEEHVGARVSVLGTNVLKRTGFTNG